MIAFIGSLFIATAISFAVMGFVRARSAHAADVNAVSYLGGDSLPTRSRAANPWALRAGRAITPQPKVTALSKKIERSGSGTSIEHILAAKALGGLVGLAFALWVAIARPGSGLVIGAFAIPIGYFLPDVRLNRKVEQRAKAITASLPDALDLMAILVEAGVGLETAAAKAADDAGGPLAEELHRLLHEMRMGSSRREAYSAMRDRSDSPELSRFVLALLQADKLGVAVGGVLRAQSNEMRMRRKQRARERAAKTPVKILFPLVFGIFPALLIVILGPAAIRIMHALASR